MSSKTLVVSVVIVAVFIGGFYVAATVPLIEGKEIILESFFAYSKVLSAGYFFRVPLHLDRGTVKFVFATTQKVNAFIMTEEQYYGYAESFSGYTGSIDASLDSRSGVLTCKIQESDTYYFIIENENDISVSISTFEIKQSVKETLLESLRSQ